MVRHGARIILGYDIILKAVGFAGGKLHYVGRAEDRFGVCLTIEHPDLPAVTEGQAASIIDTAMFCIYPDYSVRIQPRPRRWFSIIYGAIKVAIKYIKLTSKDLQE